MREKFQQNPFSDSLVFMLAAIIGVMTGVYTHAYDENARIPFARTAINMLTATIASVMFGQIVKILLSPNNTDPQIDRLLPINDPLDVVVADILEEEFGVTLFARPDTTPRSPQVESPEPEQREGSNNSLVFSSSDDIGAGDAHGLQQEYNPRPARNTRCIMQ